MPRTNSLEKTLMMGKIEGQRRRRQQRIRRLDSVTDSTNMNLSKLPEIVKDRGAWHAAVHGVTESQTWLSNWTRTAYTIPASDHLDNLLHSFFPPPHLFPSRSPQPNSQYESLSLCNEKGPVYFRSYYLRLQEHACLYQSRLSSPKGFPFSERQTSYKVAMAQFCSSSITCINAHNNKTISLHTANSHRSHPTPFLNSVWHQRVTPSPLNTSFIF